eukprot:scaffold76443_cov22-Tisochrysis_lutea.AAC.1
MVGLTVSADFWIFPQFTQAVAQRRHLHMHPPLWAIGCLIMQCVHKGLYLASRNHRLTEGVQGEYLAEGGRNSKGAGGAGSSSSSCPLPDDGGLGGGWDVAWPAAGVGAWGAGEAPAVEGAAAAGAAVVVATYIWLLYQEKCRKLTGGKRMS